MVEEEDLRGTEIEVWEEEEQRGVCRGVTMDVHNLDELIVKEVRAKVET
jgi:hypothetical protein